MAQIPAQDTFLKDGTPVVIRVCELEDASELIATATEYIAQNEGQVWEPGEFKMTLENERNWIQEMLASPSKLLLVAEGGGRIVGNLDFAAGSRIRTAHAGELGMGMLLEWRGRGLGSALLSAFFQWAETVQGLEKISLRALANNARGLALYRKHGFREEGRKEAEFKFDDGSYVDEVLMAKFLGRD